MRDRKITLRARVLRQESTVAERDLWALLRGNRIEGWKFRRQSGVAGYVVDFVCHNPRLVVEVDGPVHDEPEQVKFDNQRTAEIEAEGFAVLRLDEAMIRREPAQAMMAIMYVGRRLLQGLPAMPEDDE